MEIFYSTCRPFPVTNYTLYWTTQTLFELWIHVFSNGSSALCRLVPRYSYLIAVCVRAYWRFLCFLSCGVNREIPPVRLRSGHGPTSPRDDLHQRTQDVKASCLNPASAVTGLVMWQGRSVDAEDVLPVVGKRGNKRGGDEEKTAHGGTEIPLHHPH